MLPADPGPRGLVRAVSWEDLFFLPVSHDHVHHLWVMRELLRLPLSTFDLHHRTLSLVLAQRLATVSPAPAVRSYALGTVVAPLLVWRREHQHTAARAIQECLHLSCPDRPECRVWHWTLVPRCSGAPTLAAMARRFAEAGLLPSLRHLAARCTGGGGDRPPPFPAWETLERLGGRRARGGGGGMATTYDNDGATALWFPPEVLFYVVRHTRHGGRGAGDPLDVLNAAPPRHHGQLPPWVLPALLTLCDPGTTPDELAIVVDDALAELAAEPSEAVAVLRRVNWGALPLLWRPTVLPGEDPGWVPPAESALSQARLVARAVRTARAEAARRRGPDSAAARLIDWVAVESEARRLLAAALHGPLSDTC